MNNTFTLFIFLCIKSSCIISQDKINFFSNYPRLKDVALDNPPKGGRAQGKPRWGYCYSKSSSKWFNSNFSWLRMYSLIVSSSRPTVLTQYPVDQKCNPVTLLFLRARCILTALSPLIYPIVLAILYFGGMLRHICKWSDIACPSNSFIPRCRHKSRIISPTFCFVFPYSTLCRYFGTITTWYLQSHRTWDKLFHSCICYTSCPGLGFPWGGTYFTLFSPNR